MIQLDTIIFLIVKTGHHGMLNNLLFELVVSVVVGESEPGADTVWRHLRRNLHVVPGRHL